MATTTSLATVTSQLYLAMDVQVDYYFHLIVFCFIIIMWYARKQEHSRDAFLNNQQPVSFKKADINNELNGLLPGKFHIKTQFYIL